jgi:hypothetical protein
MKTIIGIFAVSSLLCLGGLVSCTTTTAANDNFQQDTAVLPDFDEVGLENGSTRYSSDSYKSTIPFAQEARKSTAVSGGRGGVEVFARTTKRTARVVAERTAKHR